LLIEFSSDECAALETILAETCRRVEDKGIINRTRRDLSRTQQQTDRVGLYGEFAVAKAFGLGLDACGLLLKGVRLDGGVDLVLPGGATAQVKTVAVHTNPNRSFWFALETTNLDEFSADVGIMVFWLLKTPHLAKIAGYVTRERFRAEHQIEDLGTGPRAVMGSGRFDQIQKLIVSGPRAERA